MTQEIIQQNNTDLQALSIEDRLKWAWEKYPHQLTLTSSFQTQSVALLYMVSKAIPDIPVLFLDTGFHFPETLAFRDTLIDKFNLNVLNVSTAMGHQGFKNNYGNLYLTDPDLCCHINKTHPLQTKLKEYKGWITGVRGDQTKERAAMELFSVTEEGKVKICPMLDWTSKDLWSFHNEHDLPDHPLLVKGYMSIGCAPCTRAVVDPNDERSGRWADNCKTECGIHTNLNNKQSDKS